MNHVNDQRAIRTGEKSVSERGAGKVVSSNVGGSSAPSPDFKSAEAMLGAPDHDALPVNGVEVTKGASSVPEVNLNTGDKSVKPSKESYSLKG